MPYTCPRCGADDMNDEIDGDTRVLCTGCNAVWKPEPEPRLIDVPPTTEQRRRDLQ